MPPPTAQSLAGSYQLHPGARPGITGHRPILQPGRLARLVQGHPDPQLPELLGSVFTLCAHAHMRTSRHVLGLAAMAQDAPVFHLLETARDHLRSMALDWPAWLPEPVTGSASLRWLAGCPLALAGPLRAPNEDAAWKALAALHAWLAHSVLQTDTDSWLARHRPSDALAKWCQEQASRLLPAHCLAYWLGSALPEHYATPVLDVLHPDPARQSRQLLALGQCIAKQVDFAQYPTWQGQCAENGPWTRLRHRAVGINPTFSLRLASRWVDLLEITCATPDSASDQVLSSGTLALGDGQTLAWCEMARGLLLHWCQRDSSGAVQDYKVIAPTEWNFHPQGTLARTVSALRADDRRTAKALAAAFDPCVACSV